MMCIIATVSMAESTGVYLALSDLTGEKLDSKRLRNGYRAEGAAVLLGGIFNTFPYTGFSQNVGLVRISGIKHVVQLLYSLVPCDSWLLPKIRCNGTNDSSPVLGGAMIVLSVWLLKGFKCSIKLISKITNTTLSLLRFQSLVELVLTEQISLAFKYSSNVLNKWYCIAALLLLFN